MKRKTVNKTTKWNLPALITFAIAIAAISFYLGTIYKSSTGDYQAEAANRKPDFSDYANCDSYKTDPTDVIPPTVSITQPTNGAIVPKKKPFEILVNATDDKSQVFLSLYVDNTFKFPYMSFYNTEDPSVQGTVLWSANQPNVTQTLTIKACDHGGNTSWSAPIQITTN